MNPNHMLLLADAEAQGYYWMLRYLAWILWGLLFAGIGMLVVRFLWKNRRSRAEELERENRRLREELADVQKLLKN